VDIFLDALGDDIHEMLFDDDVGEDYRGLDSDRDTEAEVETAVRFFPNVLSREGGRYGWYPIKSLSSTFDNSYSEVPNLKAVSFIHLLARLAIEFDTFEHHERGGLLNLNEDDDVHVDTLQCLVCSNGSMRGEEHNQLVDNAFLEEFIRLRHMDLLKKDDILDYELVHGLCCQSYFAENRFRFLVEWNPTSLIQTDIFGCVPLNYAANHSSFQGFRSVFDFGIRYFPSKRGISLLFQKQDDGYTPFQLACELFERNEVKEAVEDTLARCSTTAPINSVHALMLAATDEHIHLVGVYFVLRRQPDVLTRMIRRRLTNNNNNSYRTGGQDNNDDDNDDNDDDHDDDDFVNRHDDAVGNNDRKTRKRKRDN